MNPTLLLRYSFLSFLQIFIRCNLLFLITKYDFPGSEPPYPTSIAGKPTSKLQFPGPIVSFPTSELPFSSSIARFPTSEAPCPTSIAGFSSSEAPFPASIAGLSTSGLHFSEILSVHTWVAYCYSSSSSCFR